MSDKATARMTQDYFSKGAVRPRGAKRPVQTEDPLSRVPFNFTGEALIERFLNPRDASRCYGEHDHKADCLCDVDVSKTAGMTFDKVPPRLFNVETAEDLVRAAAHIWVDMDVTPPWREGHQRTVMGATDTVPEERFPELIADIASGETAAKIDKRYGHFRRRDFVFIRNLMEAPATTRKLKWRLVEELHDQGLDPAEIRNELGRRGEYTVAEAHSIDKVLREMGIRPHPLLPRRGPELDYKRVEELRLKQGLSWDKCIDALEAETGYRYGVGTIYRAVRAIREAAAADESVA